MIIFCNCHLNLNTFQIVCHKATSQENVMGFQIQIWLPVMKQDIISFMSTVEDTRTKSIFQVKSSWALLSFRYMWGHTVERNVVPHRTTVLHKYRHTTRVWTTGELGGARLPLIRHGLPWKSDLWNFGGSQKILTMCYFDVQFQFGVMWSSWIIMCKIAKISFNAWRRFKPNSLQ